MSWTRFAKSFTSGLFANRPAAGSEGRVYRATDVDGALYVDDGSNWKKVGLSLIATETFSTSTTYSIPSGANIIYMELIGGGSGGNSGHKVYTNASNPSDKFPKAASALAYGGSGGKGGYWDSTTMLVKNQLAPLVLTIGAGSAGIVGAGVPAAGGRTIVNSSGNDFYFSVNGGSFEGNDFSSDGGNYVDGTVYTNGMGSTGKSHYKGGADGGKGNDAGASGGAGGQRITTGDPGMYMNFAVANPMMRTAFVPPAVYLNGGGAAGAVGNGSHATNGTGAGGGGGSGPDGAGGNGAYPGGGGGGGGFPAYGSGPGYSAVFHTYATAPGGNGGNGQIKIWVYA